MVAGDRPVGDAVNRRPTDLEVGRAVAYNESLRAPEQSELEHSEVLALFADSEPEIEVAFDDMAAFWGALDSQYVATFGSYDLDCMVGSGRTPLDAIVDLLDRAES